MYSNRTPPIPQALRKANEDWEWAVVSSWPPQSVTYRLSRPPAETRYLKIVRASSPQVRLEEARLSWARPHLPVPDVLESGSDDRVDWLVTQALAGRDGTDETLLRQPQHLVDVLARGLRRFHEAPVGDCPFDFRLEYALQYAKQRAARGAIDPERDFHPEHQHLTVAAALRQLEREKPRSEDLVVCHGDYCFPNALIEGDRVVGFVDLGGLGVADRWWDLAVATWSTVWNVGPGYEEAFLTAYGAEPNPDQIDYYRLLYDLVS